MVPNYCTRLRNSSGLSRALPRSFLFFFAAASVLLLLVVGVLGQGVRQHTEDGDGRPDGAERGHLGLEHNDRGDDDDHALDGVAHGVGDGVHAVQCQEGHLVVRVVVESGEEHPEGKGLPGEAGGGDGSVPGGLEARALNGQGDGGEHGAGNQGQHGVQVGGIHVLAHRGGAHALLGKDAAQGARNVGGHGPAEGRPGEGELLEGGQSHTHNHRDQGGVHLPGKKLAQEDSTEKGSEQGLSSLHNVGEGHSPSAQGDDCRHMGQGVHGADGEEGFDVLHGELRGLSDAKEPHGHEEENAGHHLHGCHSPGCWDSVEGFLVVDVIPNVQSVPQTEVHTNLQSGLHVLGHTATDRDGILRELRL
mmetsp:Transcript_18623/g.29157  ORF Transcript_18623/g.29157 Transcript_18623/m.29157 type:complete len:362 (+) Transcript_18623:342-1427(+)